jgi:hypothetical protein
VILAQPDVEDVIVAVTSILEANLPANLQAVDASKATQLNPAPPRQWIFGDFSTVPQLPCVLVTSDQTSTRKDEYGWRDQQYVVTIEAYYAHTDLQTLSRILRRYGAAVDDTLRQNNTLGGLVKNIANITQHYSQTMKGQPGLYQAVTVECQVHLITD